MSLCSELQQHGEKYFYVIIMYECRLSGSCTLYVVRRETKRFSTKILRIFRMWPFNLAIHPTTWKIITSLVANNQPGSVSLHFSINKMLRLAFFHGG